MKVFFFFLLFWCTIIARAQHQNLPKTGIEKKGRTHLLIAPAKPRAGSTITITYNPRNTVFFGIDSFEATAYLLEGSLPLAIDIPLQKSNGIYTGSFHINDSTRAFFISFSKQVGGEILTDNNDESGYYSAVFDSKGREVLGAFHALALGFTSYSGIWKMKKDTERANGFSKKEFISATSRAKLYNEYFTYLGQTGKDADKELLKKQLKQHLENKSLSERDLFKVKDLYENVLKDKPSSQAVYASIKRKFPNGSWGREELFNQFFDDTSITKRVEIFNLVLSRYPPTKDENKFTAQAMAFTIADYYTNSGEYEKIDAYIPYLFDKALLASFYSHLAGIMSGGGIIYNKPLNVPKGLELAKKAMDITLEEMSRGALKPSFLTKNQYRRKRNLTYHSYQYIYAMLLFFNHEYDLAYSTLKQSVEVTNGNNVIMNHNFTVLTEKVKGEAAAQKELEWFISEGKANPAMKNQLKQIYLKNNSEAQFTKYMGELERAVFNKLKADLAKKMINSLAPSFTLKNLYGEKVSLTSLKGKVVVIDFWSTWCTPCKASFPAMQKTMEKYKNNPDVMFLFIDTWESGSEREKEVKEFIEKNRYPFIVLYDEARNGNYADYIVVSDYKVPGLPTKFVIDRNGRIRFKSSGYNGSPDGLINELSAMIELASEASIPAVK